MIEAERHQAVAAEPDQRHNVVPDKEVAERRADNRGYRGDNQPHR
jgi:hypothetical protein